MHPIIISLHQTVQGNCWTCPINNPKSILFDGVMMGRRIFLLTSKQSSKKDLETWPKINLPGLGLMTLSIILIVHSNGKITCSRKPVSGRDRMRTPLHTLRTLETCKKKHVLFDSESFKVCGRSQV